MSSTAEHDLVDSFKVDSLAVRVFDAREAAGQAAARAVAADMEEVAGEQTALGMVFASAPSQQELLDALVDIPDLPWNRVTAFHLDEYVGTGAEAPQSFARFLKDNLFDHVRAREVNYLDGLAPSAQSERDRYEALLESHRLDIACIGVGENGHIAFNEPWDSDFEDSRLVRLIELDEASRQQQVNEGLFRELSEVPTEAMTLTVPAILSAKRIHCIVPGRNKAAAVKRTLEGHIGPHCPASALRTHSGAVLYLDVESASLLDGLD